MTAEPAVEWVTEGFLKGEWMAYYSATDSQRQADLDYEAACRNFDGPIRLVKITRELVREK